MREDSVAFWCLVMGEGLVKWKEGLVDMLEDRLGLV
jgi:hypothetical protein